MRRRDEFISKSECATNSSTLRPQGFLHDGSIASMRTAPRRGQSRTVFGISGLLIRLLVLSSLTNQAFAQAPATSQYELESILVTGTTRITENTFREQLLIKDHLIMTDEWMNEARTKILGLGLFQDVFFSLKKGSKPGLAQLIVKAEDDETILSDWAVGGEFGLTMTEPTPQFGEDSAFRGYRLGLVARNILRESHRAAFLGDIDSRGNLVYGQFAYGLPRFLSESIQFDGALTLVEPKERYYETEGFGSKIQSLWTRQRSGFDLIYGAAWYTNTHNRYQLANWPEVVAGPKFGIRRETRFLGFFPTNGYRAAASLIPSLVHRNEPVLETELAGTILPFSFIAFTVSGKGINIGQKAVSTRGEFKLEMPISVKTRGLSSLFYMGIRNGQDHYKDTKISGTEGLMGFRYHSTGFIGDVNFIVVGEHPWKKIPVRGEP
jgi:hypothetical protein